VNLKGLLVEDRDGREYLLNVTQGGADEAYGIFVSQRVAGEWMQVEPDCTARESLFAALLEWFVGICMALYRGHDQQKIS